MKKVFFVMCLCVFVVAHASSAKAAGCYITPTNDYICDKTNPGNEGQTVERDTKKNVPGSNKVFKSGDIRSQYDWWMPGVLTNLGMNTSGAGSGDITVDSDAASGVGTSNWSGAECEPGKDAYEQFKEHLLSREGRRNCSYYDGVGSGCPYTGPGSGGGGDCSSGGCLTIGVGHLVKSGETQYTPCGTCISDEEVDKLFEKDASNFWKHVTSHLSEACLEDEGCFAVALGSVLYQGGTNFLRGTFSMRWQKIVDGKYKEAADGWENTKWGKQTPVRVRDWQNAIYELQKRKDAGESLGC